MCIFREFDKSNGTGIGLSFKKKKNPNGTRVRNVGNSIILIRTEIDKIPIKSERVKRFISKLFPVFNFKFLFCLLSSLSTKNTARNHSD